jgi:ParB-like chromosome segregation protein Spo0J
MTTRRRKSDKLEERPAEELSITYQPLSWLLANQAPRNPKRHDIAGVAASMNRFGYTMPVALDAKSKTVVAGHGRLEVLAKIRTAGQPPPRRVKIDERGEWLVPVVSGLSFETTEEAEAYLLADNRHTESGGYDDAMLAEMLSDVQSRINGLDGLGWSEEQARDIIASIRPEEEPATARPSNAPEDFQSVDVEAKACVQCPRCGFPVPVGE